jgi:hypothetical protein
LIRRWDHPFVAATRIEYALQRVETDFRRGQVGQRPLKAVALPLKACSRSAAQIAIVIGEIGRGGGKATKFI